MYIFCEMTQANYSCLLRMDLSGGQLFSATTPHNLHMAILELKYFEILIADNENKELKDQKFYLNTSILHKFYQRDLETLKADLNNIF